MPATIMMPQQIDLLLAVMHMCADTMSQTVAALAEKYGFDPEEANRFLASDDLKIVHKRGPVSKATKATKADKASKADKPKRAKTGYLLYGDDVRDAVKESLASELDEGVKLKPQDVVRAIAARWREEDQETRDEWNTKAKTPATSDEDYESVN
jgi:hypothetical protein